MVDVPVVEAKNVERGRGEKAGTELAGGGSARGVSIARCVDPAISLGEVGRRRREG